MLVGMIVAVLITLFGTGVTYSIVAAVQGPKSPEAIEKKKRDDLSWPAQEVMKSNDLLEGDSRIVDLEGYFRALDVKYGGIESVNAHYASSGNGYYSWYNCPQTRRWLDSDRNRYSPTGIYLTKKDFPCAQCDEYKSIEEEIQKLISAQAEQKRAMEIAGVQFDLDRRAEIMAHLRNERQVTTEVTREITR